MGVHIADVTHFLLPYTAMDAEAALRGTTVYLVQVCIGLVWTCRGGDITMHLFMGINQIKGLFAQ